MILNGERLLVFLKGKQGVSVTNITLTDDNKLDFALSDGTHCYTNSVAGKDGIDGQDGVGVLAVEQITTSTVDGGTNVIRVTLTDGTTTNFTVKNGAKGSAGADGKDGEKGEKGDSGVTVATQGQPTFTVENGQLYVYIPTGSENPYELGEDGYLYMTVPKITGD